MTPRWPSLFLIGAPKCGTTSLAGWLAGHPSLVMSSPKEPGFYAPDVAVPRLAETEADYLAMFGPTEAHQLRAEASTSYLRSKVAVPRILGDRPDARFVVCLRNPVEMAPSVHAQLVRSGREPVADFETAWTMQAARRDAPQRHRTDHNPADWQYGDMCHLGRQLAALLETVPRARVHTVFLDDLKTDPRRAYAGVLAFAGLRDDGRAHFPVLNARRRPRAPAIARTNLAIASLRRRLGVEPTGLGARVNRLNERAPRPDERRLSPLMRRVLIDYFRDDIRNLAQLTGRDLDHWLALEEMA